jgi:hypothetical protein
VNAIVRMTFQVHPAMGGFRKLRMHVARIAEELTLSGSDRACDTRRFPRGAARCNENGVLHSVLRPGTAIRSEHMVS